MRFLCLNESKTIGSHQLIESTCLISTVTEVDTYVEEIIREFYANLHNLEVRDCGRHIMYVWVFMYEFYPEIINWMFQLPEHSYSDMILPKNRQSRVGKKDILVINKVMNWKITQKLRKASEFPQL